MDFLRVMRFGSARKSMNKPESEPDLVDDRYEHDVPFNEDDKEYNNVSEDQEEDEYDDEFFTSEVKNKLKEMRKNSFMMLIPEESSAEEEDEEEGETSSSEWREGEGEFLQPWCGFDAFYDKYCEGMRFFDQMGAQQMRETGTKIPSTPPSRSYSQRLSSPFRCLSLKNMEEDEQRDHQHFNLQSDSPYANIETAYVPQTGTPSRSSSQKLSPFRCLSMKNMVEDDEQEHQHFDLQTRSPYLDIETAYVAQICLSWETLHYQYVQLSQLIFCQPQHPTCYSQSAQLFQQYEVLLQRFVENEPFEDGGRAEVYLRMRTNLPNLLQVPIIRGSEKEKGEEEGHFPVLAGDLIKIIESSVLTFRLFLKKDKGKQKSPNTASHQSIHSALIKKKMKLKKLSEKKKRNNGGRKGNLLSMVPEEVIILFGLIDVRIMERVLRMGKITKDQLRWCEEKMKNLDFSYGRIKRNHSPQLFPFP